MKKKAELNEQVVVENRFTKQQILKSWHFNQHRDLLSVILEDSEVYSIETVETLIQTYMNNEVK